jgi:hypothetical protein
LTGAGTGIGAGPAGHARGPRPGEAGQQGGDRYQQCQRSREAGGHDQAAAPAGAVDEDGIDDHLFGPGWLGVVACGVGWDGVARCDGAAPGFVVPVVAPGVPELVTPAQYRATLSAPPAAVVSSRRSRPFIGLPPSSAVRHAAHQATTCAGRGEVAVGVGVAGAEVGRGVAVDPDGAGVEMLGPVLGAGTPSAENRLCARS